MVYGFAQQSGGTIRIDSRVGEGTSVEIWLPRAPEVPDQPAPDAIAGAAERVNMQRPRNILLVDDHEGVRATTAALLEDLGHRVTTAADGVQVTTLLRNGLDDIDLVISDYAMPLMSGSEVIRKLRVARPSLPAIIITGYAETDAVSGAPEGVVIITKPFTPTRLQDAIAAASFEQR
jgi:CheY-like chemotaxis protein